MAVYVEHTEGSKKGQLEMFELEPIRIGRGPENDLRLDSQQVTRQHAEIYREGHQYFVRDLGSRNGTFVGGRRIERQTAISEGDVVQFAPGGPAIRVWSRAPGGTVVSAAPTAVSPASTAPAATEPAPAPPAIQAPEPAGERQAWRRTAIVLGAAVAVAGVVGAAVGYAWSSWWVFFGGLVGAGALESFGLLGWSWWTARRERRAHEEIPTGTGGTDNLRDLTERWTEGVNVLRRSNLQQRGEDAVDALPWYLLLGERGSGRSLAMRAARPLPSSAAALREAGPTRTFDWWFFERSVVLDVAGRYVSQADEQADSAEWRKLLALLRRTRRREPINGVVLTLTADALLGRVTDRLQEDAGLLRRRLDELGRELSVTFPVYLLVTNLDAVAGFADFFGRLPEGSFDQAMGALNEEREGRTDAAAFAERTVRTVAARLEALRLSLLNESDVATLDAAHDVFLFVEEFKALRRSLRAFAESLCRRSPYHGAPLLRGIYFTSSVQDQVGVSRLADRMGLQARRVRRNPTAQPFFARHLFAQILPDDRGLVRRTAKWHERYHVAQLAGIIATCALMLALVLAFTLSFVRNTHALAGLRIDGCQASVAGPALGPQLPEVLAQLEDCREAIESLATRSLWASLSFNFGLRHTDQVETELRRRYVDVAWRTVIEPLEARIDRKLAPGTEAPVYVAALLDRIDLVRRCRAGACAGDSEWAAPRFAAMLSTEFASDGLGGPLIARLVKTNAAFLRWQHDTAALDRIQGADSERVARWLRSGGLKPEWILASAATRFPAIVTRDFGAADGSVQVNGPYTARAWKEAIEPLVLGLRGIQAGQAETSAMLARFETDYRREGLRQWQAFLGAFPEGERLAGGRRDGRGLVTWVVGPESPYRRVVDAAATNTAPLVPDLNAEVPAWARALQRYAALRAKLAEIQKLSPEEQKTRMKSGEREAASHLAGYHEALDQLRAEVATPETAYASARRAFMEGEPGARSTHPVQKARWSLGSLRALLGGEQGDSRIFWLLLDRPVELGWRVVLDQAGVHLQQQWEAVWPELATPDTPAAQRASRVIGFYNERLTALLELRGDRYVPRSLFNETVKFTVGFLDYLARARRFSPESAVRSEPPRQIVTGL